MKSPERSVRSFCTMFDTYLKYSIINCHIFPDNLKLANITTVFKKEDSN